MVYEQKHPKEHDENFTFFARAKRTSPERLAELSEFALEDPIIRVVLDSVGGMVIILDSNRQILAANEDLLRALRLPTSDDLVGRRPGEALGCLNASEAPSGCGTSEKCRYCGAVLSMLATQHDGLVHDDECYLTMKQDGQLKSLEFKVRSSPLDLADEQILVLVLQDISAHKRRDVLERLFFHDIFNTLSGLVGFGEILRTSGAGVAAQKILSITSVLTQEIQAHRLLVEAEQGRLALEITGRRVADIFEQLRDVFRGYPNLGDRLVGIEEISEQKNFAIWCDQRLLSRVLTNMVKNGLEATAPGGVVHVWAERKPKGLSFYVDNEGYIPEEVRSQIFKRTFSTKGEPGRGLGTYSMKLFGEQYLQGKVWFTSSPEYGTRFCLDLPQSVLNQHT